MGATRASAHDRAIFIQRTTPPCPRRLAGTCRSARHATLITGARGLPCVTIGGPLDFEMNVIRPGEYIDRPPLRRGAIFAVAGIHPPLTGDLQLAPVARSAGVHR